MGKKTTALVLATLIAVTLMAACAPAQTPTPTSAFGTAAPTATLGGAAATATPTTSLGVTATSTPLTGAETPTP